MTEVSTETDIDFAAFHDAINNILSSSSISIAETSIQYLQQMIENIYETQYSVPELFKQYIQNMIECTNAPFDSLEPVIAYIEKNKKLLDYDMTLEETFEQIPFLTSKEVSLLGTVLSALSSLQDQDAVVFIAWLLIALLTIFSKDK